MPTLKTNKRATKPARRRSPKLAPASWLDALGAAHGYLRNERKLYEIFGDDEGAARVRKHEDTLEKAVAAERSRASSGGDMP